MTRPRADTAAVSRDQTYNSDPVLAPLPLSVEEATILQQDPGMVRKRDIEHLMQRVLATALQVREVRRHYDIELRRRTEALPRPGLTSTLSPEQAAKFLSPDQLSKLFDRFSQERLAALEVVQQRATEDYRHLQETIDDTIAVLLHAVNQPGVEPLVGQEIGRIVERLQATRRQNPATGLVP